MNILGVDYGKKNIGLAWVQEGLDVVLPYGVIKEKVESRKEQLIDLIKKEGIDKIVVGLPIGLDGKENENTKNVQRFVEDLKTQIDIPVEFVDERFTSQQADRMEGGEASRDEKAAMVILQSYIEKQK